MKTIFKIVVTTLLAAICMAAVTTPGYVPNSDTAVVSTTVSLYDMHLNNQSAGSADCVIKDQSTNCGGGACSLWGPATLGASGSASSVVSWSFRGVPATGGFKWSCTVASAVVGSIQYN